MLHTKQDVEVFWRKMIDNPGMFQVKRLYDVEGASNTKTFVK